MVYYGDWRTDSVPVWATSGIGSTTIGTPTWGWSSSASTPSSQPDADPRVQDSWNGTGTLNGPSSGYGNSAFQVMWNNRNAGGFITGSNSQWTMSWMTVSRNDPTVTEGTLPSSVYNSTTGTFVDPNVIGVEWGGQGPALGQRLQVVMRSGWKHPATDPIHVKTLDNNPQPTFMTGAAVAALADLGTLPAGSGSAIINDPPVALTGDDTLTVGLVDTYTQAQAIPALPPGEEYFLEVDLPYTLTLKTQFQPPYRLIYANSRAPHLRVMQRGSDGSGATGGRRILGNRTVQASNRATGIR